MFLPWSGSMSFDFYGHTALAGYSTQRHFSFLILLTIPGWPSLLWIRAPSLLGEPNPLVAPLSFQGLGTSAPSSLSAPVCSSIQHTLPQWYCPYPQLPVFCNMLLTDLYLIYILHLKPDPSIQLPTRYLDLKVQVSMIKVIIEIPAPCSYCTACLPVFLHLLSRTPLLPLRSPQDTVSPSLILSLLFHPQFSAALHQWLIWVSITTLAT